MYVFKTVTYCYIYSLAFKSFNAILQVSKQRIYMADILKTYFMLRAQGMIPPDAWAWACSIQNIGL